MRRALPILAVLLTASLAHAAVQTRGPEDFGGRNELSAHIGYQAGFGELLGSPSGLKLFAEYGYRFHRIVWFDLQLNNTFGFGGSDGLCAGSAFAHCYRGGWNVELAGGVKLKIPVQAAPIVFEFPLLAAFEGLYNRDCGDNGVAFPALRAGAGFKYFVTRKIGVGVGLDFTFGPAFHASSSNPTTCRTGTYTDFFGAFDFMTGAEFIL